MEPDKIVAVYDEALAIMEQERDEARAELAALESLLDRVTIERDEARAAIKVPDDMAELQRQREQAMREAFFWKIRFSEVIARLDAIGSALTGSVNKRATSL